MTGVSGVTGASASPALLDLPEGEVAALLPRVPRRGAAHPAVLGIAGAPGAGKSTLTATLVAAARAEGLRVAEVGMDGYHLAQELLIARGQTEIKGAPATFDAAGYVHLLRRIRAGERVYAPRYERGAGNPIANAVEVDPAVDLVITEGNYLLLPEGAWAGVRGELDAAWFLELASQVRQERLLARHLAHGKDPERARAFAYGSDEHNARAVAASRERADLVLRLRPAAPPSGRMGA
ncbi:nucleoside/nucleotide kinase family protein [Serinibacter salmoneus]|uniref:Pantothenate kinase n=1 Tax=Serinibacter salmoneus TaxID=556530 RepID=A0A2A9CYB8_9MICO|nr:nucleoside/nucleotide kinase family protein [Serinibacter salmoneus]PFG19424.1 pantothenate kinase [Serinibacter salmoneus]